MGVSLKVVERGFCRGRDIRVIWIGFSGNRVGSVKCLVVEFGLGRVLFRSCFCCRSWSKSVWFAVK